MKQSNPMKKTEEGKALSYRALLEYGKNILVQERIADASNDSWYLLEFVTGMDRGTYYLCQEEMVPEKHREKYLQLLELRRCHVPLQYITGKQEFMGLPFLVNRHVLIPRQDTEFLVEQALSYVKGKTVLDMCTGSGCIAVSLMHYGGAAECWAADISEEALQLAEENAKRNQETIRLVQSDLFENISQRFDVIVANPPYISAKMMKRLMPEVRCHEPEAALAGGQDGLDFYREITKQAPFFLNPGGRLFYEIGFDQAAAVTEMMDHAGFVEIVCKKDYSGNDRIVFGQYRKADAAGKQLAEMGKKCLIN